MALEVPPKGNEYGNHKDRCPLETIARIESILHMVGIGDTSPIREKRFNPAPHCHSVNIADPGFPILTANGKGVTDEYSRASAYAELIERMQWYYTLWFSRLGGILQREPMHPDGEDVSVSKLLKDAPEIMHELVEDADAIPVETLHCLPFWDVRRGVERLLPYELMFWKTYSTGMCAGNTNEESLVQGICEIMERYVARQVMEGTFSAPTIPATALPCLSSGIRHMIESLEDSGLKLIIKDCTMGGTLPVLAAIVIDEANDRFGLDFGCDPVFDVALQRCITELFQGRMELEFPYSYWKEGPPPLKDFFNNVHTALPRLLPDATGGQYQKAFTVKGQSNTECLQFLQSKVQALGAAIYVRDFSFLGFPTHYVYIQGLPALESLSREECHFVLQNADECLDIMFRIHEENKEDIERLAQHYADKLRKETPFSGCLVNSLYTPFLPVPVQEWLDPRAFVAFVFIETNRFEEALNVLEDERISFSQSQNKELWLLLAEYCRLLKSNIQPEEMSMELEAQYGHGPYGQSIPHLLNRQWASLYLQESAQIPGRKFDGLPMPRCSSPFSCITCPLSRKCLLKRFIEIREKCKKAYRLVDQTRLARVFSSERI